MVIVNPSIMLGRVMHKRLMPKNKKNSFHYGVYYIAIPLRMVEDESLDMHIPLNRFGLHSFYVKDHGLCDGSSLTAWAFSLLMSYGIEGVEQISLICMPRVLGYVFNPVSFWLCYDADKYIKAVICEVNNTFGETHSYVCAHGDGSAIVPSKGLHTQKLFHVSPFLKREGSYDFLFNIKADHCAIQINYLNDSDQKQLVTSLVGNFQPMSQKTLWVAFLTHPLITFKAIMLIHYQGLKLALKRVGYNRKPSQQRKKVTGSDGLEANSDV